MKKYNNPEIQFIKLERADILEGSNQGEWDIINPKKMFMD